MLRAKNEQGEWITPALMGKDAIELLRNQLFFCPECKEKVIIRAGPRVTAHFAHTKKSTCTLSNKGGEGAYHNRGKLLLFEWLKNQQLQPQLEMFLSEIKQRPDLYFEINQQKIVIEFQCTTISIAEIKKRNAGFRKANIIPIWILGENQLDRLSTYHFRLKAFTQELLHPLHTKQHPSLIYFDPEKQVFITLSDVYLINTSRAVANVATRPLRNITLRQLFSQNNFSNEKLYSIWENEKRNFRLQYNKVYGKELTWRRWLYSKQLHVEQLPSIIHLPIKRQYMMNTPLWHWQSRFIIDFFHPLPLRTSFTVNEYYSNSYHSQYVLQEYLALLAELNIVKLDRQLRWIKQKPIIFHRYIEDALKGDAQLIERLMKR